MRLSETRYIIETNLPLLDFVKQADTSSANTKSISRAYEIIPAIDNLSKIKCLKPVLAKITASKIYSISMDTFTTDTSTADHFFNAINELKQQCKLIIALSNETIPPMDENTICLKLPVDSSFDLMLNVTQTFNKLCNLINSNQNIDGCIKLSGVESGSIWLYAVASKAAAALFDTITGNIYNIANKHINYKKNVKMLEQLEIETDAKKKEQEVLNKLCDKFIEELDGNNGLKMPADERKQWVRSIKDMAEIVEGGVEIHPSLAAPKEKQSASSSTIAALANDSKELNALASPPTESSVDTPESNLATNNDAGDE